MEKKIRLTALLTLWLTLTSWGQISQTNWATAGIRPGSAGPAAKDRQEAMFSIEAALKNRPNDILHPGSKSETIRAYLNDFRVNNENYYSAFQQNQADLACSRWPMTAWVVWRDERSPNGDIYLQRFDSLMNKADDNIKVNDDTIQASQFQPDVDCDSVGNAVVVWIDNRGPGGWGQRFDKNGNRLGANFKLRQDTVSLAIFYTAVAMIEGRDSLPSPAAIMADSPTG